MSTLITPEYFIGDISITGHEANRAAREKLCLYISQYEQEFLIKALGYGFMEKVTSGIATSESRFVKLKDGANFAVAGGRNIYVPGLAKGYQQPSPVANYIYYWVQRSMETQTTSTGEVNTETEKAKIASANAKAVRAWNMSARYCRELWRVLKQAVDESGAKLYPEFDEQYVDLGHFEVINILGI